MTRMRCNILAALLLTAAAMPWASAQDAAAPLNPQQETAKLVAVLAGDAPQFDKVLACKRLALIGTKDAVPVLAKMLADDKMAHYARYALEPIADPSVDQALRDAAARLKGGLQVGAINSIGARRDAGAVELLSKLLKDADPNTAAAASAALGRIGTPEASQALQQALAAASGQARATIADACLTCAEQLVARNQRDQAVALYEVLRKTELPKRFAIAATRGAILARQAAGVPLLVEQLGNANPDLFGVAMRSARELPGPEVTQALIAHLPKVPAERQSLLIVLLGDRGDAAALPTVLAAAKSGPLPVRLAAVQALRQLGTASAVSVLMEAAAQPDETLAQAAQATLVGLPGKEIDAAVLAALSQGDARQKIMALDLIGRRRIEAALPTLIKLADDADEALRLAAIAALGGTLPGEQLSLLTAKVVKPATPKDGEAAEAALKASALRIPDRDVPAQKVVDAMAQAPTPVKIKLLGLLAALGGNKALQSVAAAVDDADPEVQDAASRLLGEWMTADVAPVLLEMAKTQKNAKYKIRALRGFIRVARQLDMPDAQRLELCHQALAASERKDEKRLVIDVLGRIPTREALNAAMSHLDGELKEDAARSAVSIGEKMLPRQAKAVAQAMQKVIAANVGGETATRAKLVLQQAAK